MLTCVMTVVVVEPCGPWWSFFFFDQGQVLDGGVADSGTIDSDPGKDAGAGLEATDAQSSTQDVGDGPLLEAPM